MPSFRHILIFLIFFVFFASLFSFKLLRRIKLTPSLSPEPASPVLNPTELPSDGIVSLVLVGDVMLGRMVERKSEEVQDFSTPFRRVAQYLSRADLVFANLENPILKNCPPHHTGFKFCATPRMLEGLSLAGIDVVTIANNHSRDFGPQGVAETQEFLRNKGIHITGLGELVVLEKGGMKFGFLGFNKAQEENPKLSVGELELIRESDSKADFLVVGMHWGVEYRDKALPGVRKLARELVEAGADVVVGHHPHWIQENESIDGKPVFYSLGNFVFDQFWSEETRRGLVVKLIFEDRRIANQELLPVYINSSAQPEFIKD